MVNLDWFKLSAVEENNPLLLLPGEKNTGYTLNFKHNHANVRSRSNFVI
ncbi:hypothetical protein [Fischerella sp. JS2]|nr:hypothetical protein [Fischerella sp. JS2]